MQPHPFSQLRQQYHQLVAQRNAGRLSPQQFNQMVAQLRAQDHTGAWWTIHPQTGGFLRYDGRQWVSATPPGGAPPARPPTAVRAATPVPAARPSRWRALIPFGGLILSISCGVLWMLYTTLRVGQNEPVDLLTPLIMIALPLGMWFFRKPIDQLMRPFEPLRNGIPRPMRIGAAFALPIVIGLVCSSTSSYGYGAMRWTVLISMVGAYILTYKTEAAT